MNKWLLPMRTNSLACCCCPVGALPPNFVTDGPEPEKNVGVYEIWHPRAVSESVVDDKVSCIGLFSDLTCNPVNFPAFAVKVGFEYEFQKLCSGECTWKMTKTGAINKGWEVVSIRGVCSNDGNLVSTHNCADPSKNGDKVRS